MFVHWLLIIEFPETLKTGQVSMKYAVVQLAKGFFRLSSSFSDLLSLSGVDGGELSDASTVKSVETIRISFLTEKRPENCKEPCFFLEAPPYFCDQQWLVGIVRHQP